ncbi:DUF1273 domain-containing protein [Bacillus sp. 2205SS5-2]|uniref:DUF1273 domain-containing protein n=1 Tax=Bacillus sp. 2205SS5-2 TaxID=3109031 RepID=UPI0030069080
MKVVTITGYKAHELGLFNAKDPAITYIKQAIKKELRDMLDEGLEWVLISGQLGVELWGAEVVLQLQEEYPHLQLAVLTPFQKQEEKWNEQNRELYESITINADFFDSISHKPYESPQQFRQKNVLFLQKSDATLLLYDEEKEGSPKYYFQLAKQYQEKYPYDIRQITFQDLQNIVEEEQLKNQEW